jgi:hypothetical protein
MTSDGGNTWVDCREEDPAGADQRRDPSLVKPKWFLIRHGRRRLSHDEPRQDVDQGWRQPPAGADGSDTLYAATYGRSVWTTSLADAS